MYGTRSQRYGKWASEQSFGHLGGFCVVGFGDPVAGIAAAYGVDGSAGPLRNWHRTQAVFTAIYEDLGQKLSGAGRAGHQRAQQEESFQEPTWTDPGDSQPR